MWIIACSQGKQGRSSSGTKGLCGREVEACFANVAAPGGCQHGGGSAPSATLTHPPTQKQTLARRANSSSDSCAATAGITNSVGKRKGSRGEGTCGPPAPAPPRSRLEADTLEGQAAATQLWRHTQGKRTQLHGSAQHCRTNQQHRKEESFTQRRHLRAASAQRHHDRGSKQLPWRDRLQRRGSGDEKRRERRRRHAV